MLAFLLAMLLTVSPTSNTGADQICQDEQEPYGSGLGVLSAADQARDLNAVTSVAKVLYIPYGKSTAATVGYVVKIANGNTYYESRSGPRLTVAQRNAEVKLLSTPGIQPRGIKPMASDPKIVRSAFASPLHSYFPIVFKPRAFQQSALRVEHCTPR